MTQLAPDRPSRRDRLRRSPLVKGLASVLNDPGTALPITVGVFGQWGTGKSSLMLQLEDELTGGEPGPTGRAWTPVWFDAWRYQGRDHLWVGLARAIYVQGMAAQGSWWRRARFRIALERRRKGGAVLALAAVIALGALAWLSVSIVSALRSSGWSPVAGGVAAVGAMSAALAYLGIVSDPFGRAVRGSSLRRRYDTALGPTDEAERDVAHLIDTLGTRQERGAVIVFLDDLDRCEPTVIAEALRTVSEVFGRAEGERIVFVLGVDVDLVESAVDGALADLRGTLLRINPTRGETLAAQFLERVFQLAISLDTVSEAPVASLLEPDAGGVDISPREVAEFLDQMQGLDVEDPEDLTARRREVGLSTYALDREDLLAFREAIRERRAPLLTRMSHAVRDAEQTVVSNMRLTPRSVKRFDNTFRLQLQVANSTPGSELGFSRDELLALAKWIALRLFFPQFTRVADAEVGLWTELEELMGREGGEGMVQERVALLERGIGPATVADLTPLLSAGLPEARLSRLPLDSFPTVV